MLSDPTKPDFGKCDVCNKEDAFGIAASGLGPASFAYCLHCLQQGYEPYGMLVHCCVAYEGIPDVKANWLTDNLAACGVSLEEFRQEVERQVAEMHEFYAGDLLDDGEAEEEWDH